MKKITIALLAILALTPEFFGAYYLYKKYTALTAPSGEQTDTNIKHLGVIMDGNRRWAQQAGKAKWLGHKAGVEPLKTTAEFCLKNKIPYLTAYAWSLENFKRPQEEQDYLFNVLAQEVASKEFQELHEHGVKIRFVGDRTTFPKQLVPLFTDIENKSKDNTKLTLNILFCYAGPQEIIAAARTLAEKVARHEMKPSDINAQTFEAATWLGSMPAPDLIIRTGKVNRLSGFLTYQSAHSELYFMDCFWPEVTKKHLIKALEDYKNRKRNFGK
jgi:undecaprenyl diphosphate synthase